MVLEILTGLNTEQLEVLDYLNKTWFADIS